MPEALLQFCGYTEPVTVGDVRNCYTDQSGRPSIFLLSPQIIRYLRYHFTFLLYHRPYEHKHGYNIFYYNIYIFILVVPYSTVHSNNCCGTAISTEIYVFKSNIIVRNLYGSLHIYTFFLLFLNVDIFHWLNFVLLCDLTSLIQIFLNKKQLY